MCIHTHRRHPTLSLPYLPRHLPTYLSTYPTPLLQVHAIKEAQGQTEEGGEPDYASMTPEERKRAKVFTYLLVSLGWICQYVCVFGKKRGGVVDCAAMAPGGAEAGQGACVGVTVDVAVSVWVWMVVAFCWEEGGRLCGGVGMQRFDLTLVSLCDM